MTKNTKESSILKELMKPQTCVLENLNTIIEINSKFKEFERNLKGLIDIGNKRNIQYIEQREKFEEKLVASLIKQREMDKKFVLDEIDKMHQALADSRNSNAETIDHNRDITLNQINKIIQKQSEELDLINKKFAATINRIIEDLAKQMSSKNKKFAATINTRMSKLEQRFEEYDTTMSTRVSELEQRLAILESERASP